MPTPVKTSILAALKSKIQTITTANGYKTNLTSTNVQIRNKTWDEVSSTLRPYVGIVPQEQTYNWMPANHAWVELPIELICLVNGATVDAKATALNDIMDDIIGALMGDQTLSGNCAELKVVADDSDEADVDCDGVAKVGVVIKYRRTRAIAS